MLCQSGVIVDNEDDDPLQSGNQGMVPMASVTVNGTVRWVPTSGAAAAPLRHVRVELWHRDSMGPNNYLKTTYSDNNGNYSFTYNKPLLGDYHVYIRVYAESTTFRVARDWTGITPLLEYILETPSDFLASINTRLNLLYTYENNDRHKAFYISQGLVAAQKYAVNTCGLSTNKFVNVMYPCNIPNLTAFCWQTFMGISPSYATIDTVMHEYGHFVEHCVGTYGINVPGSILDSWFDFSIFMHSTTSGHLLHANGKDFGMKLAWSEAWATAFAMMAQQQFLSELSWGNIYDRTKYTTYGPAQADSGEGQEDAVIAFLWDLFGARNTHLLAGTWTPLGNAAFWSTSMTEMKYVCMPPIG
ncbi:hypothetical protein EOM82_03575 [bacterium]|nr:hypothetical protein [bacterium]